MQTKINATVDLWQKNTNIIINAVENDESARVIILSITENGRKFEIPKNATVNIGVCKVDGKVTLTTCSFLNNLVIAPLTNQSLAAPGFAEAEIQIICEDKKITTPKFQIFVSDQCVPDGTVISSDEFNALVDALESVKEVVVLEIPSTAEDVTLISVGNPKTNKLNLKKVIINARLLLSTSAGEGLVLRVRTDAGTRYLTYKTGVTAVEGGILYNAVAEFDETTGITNTNMSLLKFPASQGTSPSDMNFNYKAYTVKTPINDIEIFVLSGNDFVPILAGSSISIKGVLA